MKTPKSIYRAIRRGKAALVNPSSTPVMGVMIVALMPKKHRLNAANKLESGRVADLNAYRLFGEYTGDKNIDNAIFSQAKLLSSMPGSLTLFRDFRGKLVRAR